MPGALDRMRRDGASESAVAAFARNLERARGGERGLIASEELEPVAELPALADLLPATALDRVAVVKVNGGLGTSRGLDAPKSLVEVKPGVTFLDVIASQARARDVPLVLMNSFATRD